jgi:hypothetical protein
MEKAPEKIYVRVKHDKVLKECNNMLNGVHELQHALRLCGIEKEIEI